MSSVPSDGLIGTAVSSSELCMTGCAKCSVCRSMVIPPLLSCAVASLRWAEPAMLSQVRGRVLRFCLLFLVVVVLVAAVSLLCRRAWLSPLGECMVESTVQVCCAVGWLCPVTDCVARCAYVLSSRCASAGWLDSTVGRLAQDISSSNRSRVVVGAIGVMSSSSLSTQKRYTRLTK